WPHSTVSAATCFLDYIGDVFNPAARNAIQVVAHKDVTFSGWAIDEPNRALASSVDVVIDGQPHRAQYGADRPDVAEYFKNPAYLKSGFQLVITQLAPGKHSVTIRVHPRDPGLYRQGPAVTFTAQ